LASRVMTTPASLEPLPIYLSVGRETFSEREIAMIKAKNIMTKEVITVTQDTPIYQAVELMATNDITGIPVIDGELNLVGVLTEKDVLRLFYAHEHEKHKTVEDFMSRPAVSFEQDTNLRDICDCLIRNNFRRVPVTSKGKVVGIVSRADIIEYILQVRLSSANCN
jgi:CBS domain-containing protein